jgi:hypothetical protein
MAEIASAIAMDATTPNKSEYARTMLEGYAAIGRELDHCCPLLRSYRALTVDEEKTLRRQLIRLAVVVVRVAMAHTTEGPVA